MTSFRYCKQDVATVDAASGPRVRLAVACALAHLRGGQGQAPVFLAPAGRSGPIALVYVMAVCSDTERDYLREVARATL